MKKIIVIGCPGSGKSTFAKKLHNILGIPLCHLDMLYWNADRTTVPKPVFLERLAVVMEKLEWIIDGNFSSIMEMRMQACDTVFFLDYPLELCLKGVEERRGKARGDIPWIETEEDLEFTEFIKNFSMQNRPQIIDLLSKYTDKKIYIFKTREEADLFLAKVQE